MNQKAKSLLKLSFFLAIAALLLFFAFRGVNIDSVVSGFRNANYLWVFLAVIAGIVSNILRSLRWQILIEPLGSTPTLKETFNAVMVGYLANLALPRMGEITRCVTLRKSSGLPFESLVGTVIVERALDVVVMVVLFIAVFFIRISFFGEFLLKNVLLPIVEKVKALVDISPLIPLLGIALFVAFVLLLRRNILGKKFKERVLSIFWGVVDGLKSLLKIKKKRAFALYTILIWVCYWLMTWLIFFATKPTAHLSALDGIFLLVVGSLGMSAPVQGGFGAFHIIIAMALGIYGISWEDGLVYAVISHESQVVSVLIIGAISMAMIFFSQKSTTLQNQSKE